jgi:hypothetical protein
MAQTPAPTGEAILMKRRAEMAKTRARLTREIDELKDRILRPFSKTQGENMAAATKRGSVSSKKKAPAKAPKAAKAMKTVKKTAGKALKKTQEVLGDMLAGAAIGAVKGAAEAVTPNGKKQGGKPSKKK